LRVTGGRLNTFAYEAKDVQNSGNSTPLTILEFWLDGKPLTVFYEIEPVSLGEACAVALSGLDGLHPLALDAEFTFASTDHFEGGTMTVERAARWIQTHEDAIHEPAVRDAAERVARRLFFR
jgi:hypothetical protein